MNKVLALIILSASVATSGISAMEQSAVNLVQPEVVVTEGAREAFFKKNETAIKAVIGTVIVLGVAGVVYYNRENTYVKPCLDWTAEAATASKNAVVNAATVSKDAIVNGATVSKDAVVNAATVSKDAIVNGAIATKDVVVAHPFIVTGSMLGVVAAALAAYDLSQETEASVINKVYAQLLAAVKAQDKQDTQKEVVA